jgi:hypothetical protein
MKMLWFVVADSDVSVSKADIYAVEADTDVPL